MKSNYFLIVLFLFNLLSYGQVTVTNSNIKTDNVTISNNAINFNSSPSVNLSLDIQLITSDGSINNTFGNLFLYYKTSQNDSPTQVGFQAITFVKNIPKTNYISNVSFNSIILNKDMFFANGGFFYVEYKNNDNAIFQSSIISIIGGTKISNPTVPIGNSTPYPYDIHYSDNFLPIVNSKILIPNDLTRSIDFTIHINNSSNTTTEITVYLGKRKKGSSVLVDKISLKNFFFTGNYNDNFICKDTPIAPNLIDTVNYDYILIMGLYKSTWKNNNYVLTNNGINYSLGNNNTTLYVTTTNPILFNSITDNQSLIKGEFAKPFISVQPIIWTSGGTCGNYLGCNDPKIYTNITSFQWQKRTTTENNWSNIINATNKDYKETNLLTQTTSYRRIAFFNGDYNISNLVTVSINNIPIQNSICCSQNLATKSSQPAPFIGSNTNITGIYNYQWQIAINNNTPLIWSNINGATTKDYTHVFLSPAQRGTATTTFRRLIIQNNVAISNGNEIVINRGLTVKLADTKKEYINTENDNLYIYPNPATDYLYIQNDKTSTSIDKIKVFDIFGKEINTSKIKISDDLVQINTSSLSPGIYFVYIDQNGLIVKKIIKK